MTNTLTGFETQVLDRFIPTGTFDELGGLKIAIYDYLQTERQHFIDSGAIAADQDYQSLSTRTERNLSQFLLKNEFHIGREGGKFVITEKGKHLKALGSVERYTVWEKEHKAKLIDDMRTIQKKGYLESDQLTPAQLKPPAIDDERKSNLLYYILIIVAILVFCFIGKYHKFD